MTPQTLPKPCLNHVRSPPSKLMHFIMHFNMPVGSNTPGAATQRGGFGRVLGSIWEGLGRSGASWGHFWAHFDCLLDVPNHIFLKQWSKMGSKRPFGWLLDRFWEGLGRIWMRLGRIWAFKIEAFASHGHFLNTLGVPCCLTLRYKNPRAASLRLAERHNTRGFWNHIRVLDSHGLIV